MNNSFAPAIKIDGITVTPKGYEWVLGFALAGCDWAIEKAQKPEFMDMVRADLKNEAIKTLKAIIDDHKSEIERLTKKLNQLD